MSEKHTPGPWSFGYGVTTEYGEVFGVGVTTKPDWTVVCAVSRPGDVNAIDEANARLIAAAPVLLDQLRFAVALLKPIFGNTPQVESMESAIAEAIG